MVGGDDALAQLFQAWRAQDAAEFALTEQKALHQGRTVVIEIGQHAQLFQG